MLRHLLICLSLIPALAFSAPQYIWESQGTSYTGQIDLGSSSTDPLSGSLTPSYGAINAQSAAQPPVVVISSASSGGTTTSSGMCFPADHRAIYTSDGTFTVPSGITKVYISGIGGGGAASSITSGDGAGGGSGYPALKHPVSVSPGEVVSVSIGLGGVAGALPSDGTNGGTTSFGTYLSLAGGGGAVGYNCGIGGANGGSYQAYCGAGGYGGTSSLKSTAAQSKPGGALLGGSAGSSFISSGSGTGYYHSLSSGTGLSLPFIGDSVYPANGGTPTNYGYAGQGGAGGIYISGLVAPFAGGNSGFGFGAGGGGRATTMLATTAILACLWSSGATHDERGLT